MCHSPKQCCRPSGISPVLIVMLTAVEKALTDDGGTRMCRKSLCQPCFVILMTLAHKHPLPSLCHSPQWWKRKHMLYSFGVCTERLICVYVCVYICVCDYEFVHTNAWYITNCYNCKNVWVPVYLCWCFTSVSNRRLALWGKSYLCVSLCTRACMCVCCHSAGRLPS